jgi:hypothetical protein
VHICVAGEMMTPLLARLRKRGLMRKQ